MNAPTFSADPEDDQQKESHSAQSIREMVEAAAHLVPEQAPLHAFVHHNTLHAFEHLPFEEAVVEASKILGTEPFQEESAFRAHLRSGRILPHDVTAIVAQETPADDSRLFPGGPTLIKFRTERLLNLFEIPRGQALKFILEEREPKTNFHPTVSEDRRRQILQRAVAGQLRSEQEILTELWGHLWSAAPLVRPSSKRGARRRDDLLVVTGVDTDETVHSLLIRLSAAFLDQGIAYWPMPDRSSGFLRAVRRLYGLPLPPSDRKLRGLSKELARQEAEQWSAEHTIAWALKELNVAESDVAAVVNESILALRGWAGMMRHLEVRPERAPVEAPPASLMDFLAVRLILEVVALRNVLRQHLGPRATIGDLVVATRQVHGERARQTPEPDVELVFEAFILAQALPIDLACFKDPQCSKAWLREVADLNEVERRKIMHLAYERRHRVEVLDGLSAHCRLPVQNAPAPEFQAAFCIDDREESLRRHLEESFAAVETYGYAGFFGAAMNYQGMDDVRPRPLAPVTIQPKHFILERAEDEEHEAAYRRKRQRLALVTRSLSVGSRTLTRGGALSAILGTVALIPLVLRSLFPRVAAAWVHHFEHVIAPRPQSRLNLELIGDRADAGDAQQHGYTIDEMIAVVDSALRTMSLVEEFCPLVLMVGHGSSSLNNPHEAAHDCGATGGGRGGPNARAFAAMANRPEVRKRLGEGGLSIPESTWFVGGYHNTCDDSMTYYDEDLVPSTHHAKLLAMKQALTEACVLDAHERCRRFETAPSDLPLNRAMAYARTHANDLAEPRPEYGHATNAVCIVGRRSRTRGLFLDRRAFLVSYDPDRDPSGTLLSALLRSVGPVGAGINLEYYFSFVDPSRYGCGTKLPHNITGLIGVMDGHATDLRTGLPWQMVEIHEPVRLLTIVEAKQHVLEQILANEPGLAALITNGWIQFVALDPDSEKMSVFGRDGLQPYEPESQTIPVIARSADHYSGSREHLPPAHVQTTFRETQA